MKTVFVGLALLTATLGSQAHASSIDTSCSDASQSFTLTGHGGSQADVVRIRTNHAGDTVEFLAWDEQVSIAFEKPVMLPEEKGSGWKVTSAVYEITIRPLGNTVLPSAYSRNKNADGSLTERVLCKTTYTSSPMYKGNK